MIIPAVRGSVTVQMPAWNALYQIRDFAYRVTDFHAANASGNALPVRRLDKETWRIEAPTNGQTEIRIENVTPKQCHGGLALKGSAFGWFAR